MDYGELCEDRKRQGLSQPHSCCTWLLRGNSIYMAYCACDLYLLNPKPQLTTQDGRMTEFTPQCCTKSEIVSGLAQGRRRSMATFWQPDWLSASLQGTWHSFGGHLIFLSLRGSQPHCYPILARQESLQFLRMENAQFQLGGDFPEPPLLMAPGH